MPIKFNPVIVLIKAFYKVGFFCFGCINKGLKFALYIEQEDIARNLKDGMQVRIGKLSAQLELITQGLSEAGRFLVVHGKQTKPAMIKELDDLISETQQSLDLENKDDD